MGLNAEAAREAIKRHLAGPLGTSVEEAAFLVKSLIDAKMGNEIFKETNLKGYDPREFALFAFGGAGGTHAAGYGAYVESKTIMTFPFASVFSAFGIANTDFMRSYERSCSVMLYEGHRDLWLEDYESYNSVVAELQKEALRDLEELGVSRVIWGTELYLRYGLQPHVTRVRSPRMFLESQDDVRTVYEAFENEYGRVYSPAATYLQGGVEIVGITLWSVVPSAKLDLPVFPLEGRDPSAGRKGHRAAFWGPEQGWLDSGVFDLNQLRPGNRVNGPAVIEASDTTIVIDPVHDFRVDERGNGVIEPKE
jgi:N-methylhydantoinase A/oxoprolinase/acetone carboxylase beta subunit